MTSARGTAEGRRKSIAIWTQGTDEFARAHLRGLEGAPGDFVLWGGQREGYRQAWRAFFRDWDVLLAPAINVLPYPHVERAWPRDDSDVRLTLDVNGRAVPYLHGLVYPALSTVAGQPATAFPVGRIARRPAHRPPGRGPVPGGPHADPLRRAPCPRDRRLPEAAGLGRELARRPPLRRWRRASPRFRRPVERVQLADPPARTSSHTVAPTKPITDTSERAKYVT